MSGCGSCHRIKGKVLVQIDLINAEKISAWLTIKKCVTPWAKKKNPSLCISSKHNGQINAFQKKTVMIFPNNVYLVIQLSRVSYLNSIKFKFYHWYKCILHSLGKKAPREKNITNRDKTRSPTDKLTQYVKKCYKYCSPSECYL